MTVSNYKVHAVRNNPLCIKAALWTSVNSFRRKLQSIYPSFEPPAIFLLSCIHVISTRVLPTNICRPVQTFNAFDLELAQKNILAFLKRKRVGSVYLCVSHPRSSKNRYALTFPHNNESSAFYKVIEVVLYIFLVCWVACVLFVIRGFKKIGRVVGGLNGAHLWRHLCASDGSRVYFARIWQWFLFVMLVRRLDFVSRELKNSS